MKTSDAGVALIRKWEGCYDLKTVPGKVASYLCPAGVPTIGIGSTRYMDGRPVKYNLETPDTITIEEAEELLKYEIKNSCESTIERLVKVPLLQSQYDALVSFVYNVGSGAFGDSTLLRMLNLGDYQGAADQLLRWNIGGGRVLLGLLRRREDERALFLTGTITDTELPIVVIGESGDLVLKLQEKLISKGYALSDDGIFGEQTYAAVKDFQSSYHLVADGLVGPKTWTELNQ